MMKPFLFSMILPILAGTFLIAPPLCAEVSSATDNAYLEKFREAYPQLEEVLTIEEYATPERYDRFYMGEKALEKALANPTNDSGGIAWGLAYRMISLNKMFQATGDPKYLDTNLRCIQAVMEARDDKAGKTLWTGTVAKAWGCDKYAKRGRAVFAVHTGMIAYPMLDFVRLARGSDATLERFGSVLDAIVTSASEALAFHDRQWVDGPGPDPREGHYIGLDQEEVCENKPLPGNRIGSMGRGLWLLWKVTGDETARDRALAIGHYIKNRLTIGCDDAYYWPYWLPEAPPAESVCKEEIAGEDTSHAGLTVSLPLLLAADGEVFTETDLDRLAGTVVNGFGRLGEGVLLGDITGNPKASPNYVGGPARWLRLSKRDPEVANRLLPYFLNYVKKPRPSDLAFLVDHVEAGKK